MMDDTIFPKKMRYRLSSQFFFVKTKREIQHFSSLNKFNSNTINILAFDLIHITFYFQLTDDISNQLIVTELELEIPISIMLVLEQFVCIFTFFLFFNVYRNGYIC